MEKAARRTNYKVLPIVAMHPLSAEDADSLGQDSAHDEVKDTPGQPEHPGMKKNQAGIV